MSSPMWDVPDHMWIPCNEAGEGPTDKDETTQWLCWCGNNSCELPEGQRPTLGWWHNED